MAGDAPAWTLWEVPVTIIDGEPVPEIPGNETAILETAGKVTTSSASYQTLASWTVSAAKIGKLIALELAASDYTKAQFRITIGGVVKEADWVLPAPWSGIFGETRLDTAIVVLLEGKSDGTNSIDLWGVIEGKEIG